MAYNVKNRYRRQLKGPPAKAPTGLVARKLGGGGLANRPTGLGRFQHPELGRAGMNNSALAAKKVAGPPAAGVLAAARRRTGPPVALGQRALIAGQRTKTGDRIVGAGVNRSQGNRIQTGPSARFGQKHRIGITPEGRVVHLYGSGRGKNRVVLGAGFKPPAAANPIMQRYGTPRAQATAAASERRRRRATARR